MQESETVAIFPKTERRIVVEFGTKKGFKLSIDEARVILDAVSFGDEGRIQEANMILRRFGGKCESFLAVPGRPATINGFPL